MKKAIALALAVIAVVFMCIGCTKESGKSGSAGETEWDVVEQYRKPADVAAIDLTKDDPSTDEIQFEYDDQGRVSACYYRINGKEVQVMIDYDSEEGCAQIIALTDAIIVADELIELSAFDAEKGFAVIDGYYFKGYTAG